MSLFGWLRRGASREASGANGAVLVEGRRRATDVPYMLPANMQEINRLDFQHYLLRNAFHGNYAAPVVQPRAILDVGSGTGRWAREMAAQFPYAHVVGFDIATPPPEADAGPQNYRFFQGNVLDGLPFSDASFDFVHMRLMVLALPAQSWPAVIAELARVTAPGGWVESVEYAGEKNGGPAVTQLIAWGAEASALRGIDTSYGTRVGDLMRASGLSNVQTQEVDIPLGAYGGRVGVMNAVDFLGAMRSLAGIYVEQGIAASWQAEQVLAAAQAEVNSHRFHAVSPFHFAIGRR